MSAFWLHFWSLIYLDWLLDIGYALLINIIVWAVIAILILIVYSKIREVM